MYQPKLRKQAKRMARMRFAERFAQPMVAVMAYALPITIATMMVEMTLMSGQLFVPLVLYALIQIFLAGPLFYGLMQYLIDRARGGERGLLDMFSVFSSLEQVWKAIRMYVGILVRAIPWMVVPFGLLIGYTMYCLTTDPSIMTDVEKLSMLITQVSLGGGLLMLPFLAQVLRYVGGYVLMMDDPTLTPWKAAGQAARLYRGRRWELIVFLLSFLGWQLLGMYTMGIGMLYYLSYLLMAFVLYTDHLLVQQAARNAVQEASQNPDGAQ